MDFPTGINKTENDISAEAPCEAPPEVAAVIHVSISEDKLEVYLNIEPPENCSAPTLEALMDALSSFGISDNMDSEKLKEIAENPVYNRNIVVARGIAPVDGADGTATFLIQTEKKDLKPKENADGTVDYRELDIVENVSQGQILCKITLPTEGSPGVSVFGKELRQKKGRPAPHYLGRNTELNEDGTAILSKINGQVEFSGQKIHVNLTFYVKENVGNSTGNIKVSSNLVVQGMVSSGYKIEADGNIEVKGTVENAAVRASGSVKLQSGITGSELHCSGDLKCRFIENCNVFVKGDINADYIINSNVKCGKSIKIVGKIARIIGGSCVAGQNIEAHTIGSAANVETRLELGTNQAVIERQQELINQTEELKKQIEKLKPLLCILRQLEEINRLTEDKKQVYDKAVYSQETHMNSLENANKELEEIADSIRARGFGRIISTGIIYPGTKVVMGTTNLPVTESLSSVSLYYNEKEGAICISTAR